ncbi:unnamed protein product [Prorocentrum cordatum]|uniref:Secreted protein n=1 Tax=Prorocentrum cordatum TaxID=2364126 RepID=A0ABN9SYJ0_9DINO|nr:unnamed protein product [Polarella glacialis]
MVSRRVPQTTMPATTVVINVCVLFSSSVGCRLNAQNSPTISAAMQSRRPRAHNRRKLTTVLGMRFFTNPLSMPESLKVNVIALMVTGRSILPSGLDVAGSFLRGDI